MCECESCAEMNGEIEACGMLDKSVVRDLFIAAGFTIKEGQADLKPYVYEAAEALQRALLKEALRSAMARGSEHDEMMNQRHRRLMQSK